MATQATKLRPEPHDVDASRRSEIYRGCSFSVEEIEIACRQVVAEAKTLRENFDAQKAVEVKLAAERVAKVAAQIGALSSSLAQTFTSHLSRRPRP